MFYGDTRVIPYRFENRADFERSLREGEGEARLLKTRQSSQTEEDQWLVLMVEPSGEPPFRIGVNAAHYEKIALTYLDEGDRLAVAASSEIWLLEFRGLRRIIELPELCIIDRLSYRSGEDRFLVWSDEQVGAYSLDGICLWTQWVDVITDWNRSGDVLTVTLWDGTKQQYSVLSGEPLT